MPISIPTDPFWLPVSNSSRLLAKWVSEGLGVVTPPIVVQDAPIEADKALLNH